VQAGPASRVLLQVLPAVGRVSPSLHNASITQEPTHLGHPVQPVSLGRRVLLSSGVVNFQLSLIISADVLVCTSRQAAHLPSVEH